jgi:hypothetical protein
LVRQSLPENQYKPWWEYRRPTKPKSNGRKVLVA